MPAKSQNGDDNKDYCEAGNFCLFSFTKRCSVDLQTDTKVK